MSLCGLYGMADDIIRNISIYIHICNIVCATHMYVQQFGKVFVVFVASIYIVNLIYRCRLVLTLIFVDMSKISIDLHKFLLFYLLILVIYL